MIAPFFPPRKRVGALRPYRLARHLSEFGWTPRVVSIGSGETPTVEQKRFLEELDHYTLRSPIDRTEHGVGAQKGGDARKGDDAQKGGADRLADIIDRNIPLDSWLPLFMVRYRHILAFARAGRVDAVWSTGDPWSSHWLGRRLAKDLAKPWLADFRDPWTLSSVRLRDRSRMADWIDRQIEKRILKDATHVTFTARSTMQRYLLEYPSLADRASVVHNSGLEPSESSQSNTPPSLPLDLVALSGRKDPILALFYGSFRRLSPLEPLLLVLQTAKRRAAEMGSASTFARLRVAHSGVLSPEDAQRVEQAGLKEQFITLPHVSEQHSLRVFEQADLLLLSTHPDREEIIPAKLWDYLGSSTPILSLCPNPEVEEVLAQTGCGAQFAPGREDDAAEWLLERTVKPKADIRPEHTQGEPIHPESLHPNPFQIHHDVAERQKQFSPRAMTHAVVDILERLA